MASDKEQTEQSALINLESLEVTRTRSTGAANAEESGLIDLSGFTGGAPAETRATAGVPSGGPVVAGFVAAPKKSNTGLLIVLGVIVLAILVTVTILATIMLTQDPAPPVAGTPANPAAPAATPPAAPAAPGAATPAAPAAPATPPIAAATPDGGAPDAATAAAPATDEAADPPAVAANTPKPAARPARAARKPARRSKPAAAPAAPAKPAASAEDAPPPPGQPTRVRVAPQPDPPKPAAKPAKKENSEVDDLLGALDGSKPKPSGAGGGSPVAAPAADPLLPERLTRRQIITVVRRNASAVRKCKAQPPGTAGTVNVKIQIQPNGSVGSAVVGGGPLKGTAQGNCVERTVKVFRFPQFSGSPMSINMPFAM